MQLRNLFSRPLSVKRALQSVLLALLLAGCAGGNKQVVGTWKGELKPSKDAKGLEGAFTGLANALIGDITLELNEEGKFKESVSLGAAATGTYKVSGNEVVLTPDDGKKTTTFIIDGETLRAKKDFASDPDLVMKRQTSG